MRLDEIEVMIAMRPAGSKATPRASATAKTREFAGKKKENAKHIAPATREMMESVFQSEVMTV
jgi:hypothetical protein